MYLRSFSPRAGSRCAACTELRWWSPPPATALLHLCCVQPATCRIPSGTTKAACCPPSANALRARKGLLRALDCCFGHGRGCSTNIPTCPAVSTWAYFLSKPCPVALNVHMRFYAVCTSDWQLAQQCCLLLSRRGMYGRLGCIPKVCMSRLRSTRGFFGVCGTCW